MSRLTRIRALPVVVALTVAACSSATPAPDPEALLTEVAATLAATEGLSFRITREGDPVVVGDWSIRGVTGEYAAPDSADSRVKVTIGGLVVSVRMINIGPVVWQEDPLSGAWSEVTGDSVVSVSSVFGPEGLATVISDDLGQPTFVETTELSDLPGEPLYLVRADLDTTRLSGISIGMIPAGATTADIYVSDSRELRRVVIPDPSSPDTWVIDAWDYGPGHAVSPPP